jgi:glucosyl-3-phosphoglycerate phosphatase
MGAFYIVRHGETVFNAAGRMQGATAHTPLTRAGFAQAEAMGTALRRALGPRPALELWSSPAGRALQTLAVIAEHLELDWHGAQIDARLAEIDIGAWSGRYYREVVAEAGAIRDASSNLFRCRPPGGEWYDDIAVRMGAWLGSLPPQAPARLVVTHEIASRVLRGVLTGAPARPQYGAPIADPLPQGSIVRVENGREKLVHRGGAAEAGVRAAPA